MKFDLTRIPEFARIWAEKRLNEISKVNSDNNSLLISEINKVADWVSSLPSERPKMVSKLFKLTWAQAVQAQEKWHEIISQRSERLMKERKDFGGAPDDVVEVFQVLKNDMNNDSMKNGTPFFRWVRITSPKGLDYEGNAMGHCVGQGAYDNGKTTIFSLRDLDNFPHCTVEWYQEDKIIKQIQGRANKEVVGKYHEFVKQIVDYLDPNHVFGAEHIGYIFVSLNREKRKLIKIEDLKTGDKLSGNINFSWITNQIVLPDNLHIIGNIDCYDCDGIKSLPNNLTVEGYLNIRKNNNLHNLPINLCVRDLYLSNCTRLTCLPDSLVVEGLLDLNGCTGLTSIPDNLNVGGYLDLTDCLLLTELPDNLTVWGDIYTKIEKIPDSLVVHGEFKTLDIFQDINKR